MIDDAFHPLIRLDMGLVHYFSVLGRALFTAQHLEMNCRAIAGFLHMRSQVMQHGSSVLDDGTFQKGIHQLWKKTLGQHVHGLNELCIFSDDAAQLLGAAVKARNELAHDVAMGITDRLDAELDQRIDEIRELVRKIATADKIVSSLLHILNKDPLPRKDYFKTYEERVIAWVTEETFEE